MPEAAKHQRRSRVVSPLEQLWADHPDLKRIMFKIWDGELPKNAFCIPDKHPALSGARECFFLKRAQRGWVLGEEPSEYTSKGKRRKF